MGFTILRVSDEEVLNNIQAVFNYLEDWIEKKLTGSSDPTPIEISLWSKRFPRQPGSRDTTRPDHKRPVSEKKEYPIL